MRLNLCTLQPLLRRLVVSEGRGLRHLLILLFLALFLFFAKQFSHSAARSLTAPLQKFFFPRCLGSWLSIKGRSCRPLLLSTLLGWRNAVKNLVGSALACLLLSLHLRDVWLPRWQILISYLASWCLQVRLRSWRHYVLWAAAHHVSIRAQFILWSFLLLAWSLVKLSVI